MSEQNFDTSKKAITYIAKTLKPVLEGLSGKAVAMLYDDDPDGLCSGRLLELLLKQYNISVRFKTTFIEKMKPFSRSFNEKVKDCDALFVTDFNIKGFGLFEDYLAFREKFPDKVFVGFDHHQDASNYKSDTYFNIANIQHEFVGSQFCCSKLLFELGKILGKSFDQHCWIAAIGIIGDMNHLTWKEDVLSAIAFDNIWILKDPEEKYNEIKHPEDIMDYENSPYGKASSLIFYAAAKSIYEFDKVFTYISKARNVFEFNDLMKEYADIEEEVEDYVENYDYFLKFNSNTKNKDSEVLIFEVEIKSEHDIGRIVANQISHSSENTIFFIYHRKKDNFVYVSLRLQSGIINLGEVAKDCAIFPNTNAGGHAPAAGARVPREYFKEFRELFYKKLETAKVSKTTILQGDIKK